MKNKSNERREVVLFFKTSNDKKNILSKQIFLIAIAFILVFAIFICIFTNIKKRDAVKLTDNSPEYIVSEYFLEGNNEGTVYYETRYFTNSKKTFLVVTEENGIEREETVTEIESKFTHEVVDFTISNKVSSSAIDLASYVDESGFIYTCELDTAEKFLTNEVSQGNIRLVNATPYYFECYIEDKEGNMNRGLVLYNSDLKTGTFIYKQCLEGSSIPSVIDLVDVMEKNNK